MRSIKDVAERPLKCAGHVRMLFVAGMMLGAVLGAATAGAQDKSAETKPADSKAEAEVYQTIYLTHLTDRNDANDVSTAMRNMLPQSRLFYVPSQGALVMHGSAEDMAEAKRIVADLDKVQKIYRVTYTITELDGDKRMGAQHFSLVVASGEKTTLKQGTRVPIVTGIYDQEKPGANSQVQYQDVGLNIEASLNSYLDGLKLRTKIEQTSVADDKSGVGPQDPMVRQTVLDGTSTLAQSQPLALGSFDVPGSTRRQTIEVVAELVK